MLLKPITLNKRVCQSTAIPPTSFQLALLMQREVIPHFNKVCFRFRRRGLKIFKLLCSDNFGNKHCQYRRLMVMCIDPYIVKLSITMHQCIDGSSHPYIWVKISWEGKKKPTCKTHSMSITGIVTWYWIYSIDRFTINQWHIHMILNIQHTCR